MLPAALLPGLTIVISPLLSLIQDQFKKLPVYLPGACLTSSMSSQQISDTIYALIKKRIKVLYISPERLSTSAFKKLIMTLHIEYSKHHSPSNNNNNNNNTTTSAISLLCIDEVHCMSHWSYNFRPAFLRIGKGK